MHDQAGCDLAAELSCFIGAELGHAIESFSLYMHFVCFLQDESGLSPGKFLLPLVKQAVCYTFLRFIFHFANFYFASFLFANMRTCAGHQCMPPSQKPWMEAPAFEHMTPNTGFASSTSSKWLCHNRLPLQVCCICTAMCSCHDKLLCVPAMCSCHESCHVSLPCVPAMCPCHVAQPCVPAMWSCQVSLPWDAAMCPCHVSLLYHHTMTGLRARIPCASKQNFCSLSHHIGFGQMQQWLQKAQHAGVELQSCVASIRRSYRNTEPQFKHAVSQSCVAVRALLQNHGKTEACCLYICRADTLR